MLRVAVSALMGSRRFRIAHFEVAAPPPKIIEAMVGRNLFLMPLPPMDGTQYIGWAAYHEEEGALGYLRFLVLAAAPVVKRTGRKKKPMSEIGPFDPDWTLIMGERLPSFVSETLGEPLIAREFSETIDLIEIAYRDPAREMAIAADLRAERVMDNPMGDTWVARLRWLSRIGPQELRFLALGDLTIFPGDNPETQQGPRSRYRGPWSGKSASRARG
jgi:hypothetical protein